MGIFRTYFKKNNTLIDNNLSNNSQNPVTEISYGTLNAQPSRFIFEPDFTNILNKINNGFIERDRIVSHTLKMTNTIRYAPDYKGKKSYSSEIERATSFELELFNISEDWDEGSGYDFIYNDNTYPKPIQQASNWFYRKTNIPWSISGGSYLSGSTQILATQRFETGDENIEMDVTDYINQRIGVTGVTGYTGTTYGLGIKFIDDLEKLETEFRQAVAFQTKYANSFYEPFIETVIDDTIKDDRNYFFLDKDNELYIYANAGNTFKEINVSRVEILDGGEIVNTLSGNSIVDIGNGIYKIVLNLSSDEYYDGVLLTDKWYLIVDGRNIEYENQFYLIESDKYLNFDLSNQINFNDYYFYFWGIEHRSKIKSGDIKKIKLTVKELYPNQSNNLPLDVEYRLYVTVGSDYEIDIIPYTLVNRTNNGLEFDLDTSWLIPQDYYLELRLKNGRYYENKESIKFTIVSDKIK